MVVKLVRPRPQNEPSINCRVRGIFDPKVVEWLHVANPEHVALLQKGARAWNRWRKLNPDIIPDLESAESSDFEATVRLLAEVVAQEVAPGRGPSEKGPLANRNLGNVNLAGAKLARANLSRSNLMLADLRGADLREANLAGIILTSARLGGADLRGANLHSSILRFSNLTRARLDDSILRLANFDGADVRHATLTNADLTFASLNEAKLEGTDLSGSCVYGSAVWNVDLSRAVQKELRITRTNDGVITVDDLRVAQFLYLLLNNRNIRQVIDTLTTKLVLILGRFTAEQKAILDVVKAWLSAHEYVPVLFDFEGPKSRDLTETVMTMASWARFIIADLTEPASLPKELEAIVPRLAIPVLPLLAEGKPLYKMFEDYWKYDWVLPVNRYTDPTQLVAELPNLVKPAELKAIELAKRRTNAGSNT
jgi:uncharacterized protein YjbI with pentapeptide repeats